MLIVKGKSTLRSKNSFVFSDRDIPRGIVSLILHIPRQFSAFTMDVIARCAFGMTINNLGGEDDPFMKKAKHVFSPPVNKSPMIMIPCKYRNNWYWSSMELIDNFFSCFPKIDVFFGRAHIRIGRL